MFLLSVPASLLLLSAAMQNQILGFSLRAVSIVSPNKTQGNFVQQQYHGAVSKQIHEARS